MLSLEVSSVSVWLDIFEHLTCTGLGFSILVEERCLSSLFFPGNIAKLNVVIS